MLPRVTSVFPLARKLVSLNGRAVAYTATRMYHPPKDWKPITMNDMPTPEGSWQERYDKKQRIYNMQFIGGLSWLIFTILFFKNCGLIMFNYHAPDKPLDYTGQLPEKGTW